LEIEEIPPILKLIIALILDFLSLIPVVEYLVAPVSFYFIYKVTGRPIISVLTGAEDLLPVPFDVLPDNTAVVLYYEFLK